MNTIIRMLLCCCLAVALLPVSGADKAPVNKAKTEPPPRYTVSGGITGMAATHRARVVATAPNKPSHSVTMAADGTFTLRNVPPGTYDVRPSHSLYIFSPSFRTIAVTNHDLAGLEFKAMLVPSRKK